MRGSVNRLIPAAALAAAALGLATGCGSSRVDHPPSAGASHHAAPVDGPTAPAAQNTPAKGHPDPALEALLPRKLDGVRLDRASTDGAAIFAEFGSTAWAQQMTKYLSSVGRKPADLHYAQVWDPSQSIGLDAGVFAANGVSATALQKAIINASRPDEPNLTVSRSTIGGKPVTVAVNESSGTTLYLYDYRGDVFYTGGAGESLAAQFFSSVP